MKAKINGLRIAGLTGSVPPMRHNFVEHPDPFSSNEISKLVKATGVNERRILGDTHCISDVCLHAAEVLLESLHWSPSTVDVLLFVSQNTDYILPATACLMQHRLGLSTDAACFDLPLGCSGFVYGLMVAATMLQNASGCRALVLCGDNSTRYLVPDDRSAVPLFGDAGTATAIERCESPNVFHFILGTDGSGGKNISVKAGGKRHPLVPDLEPWSAETNRELYRSARLHLNGGEVFSFSLKKVPMLVKDLLKFSDLSLTNIDRFVFHQANKMMLDHLRKRIGIDNDKFVVDMAEFGNTSSASIPLAMAHRLSAPLQAQSEIMLLAGFGVGWSWGGMIGKIGPIPKPKIVEFPENYDPLLLYE